MRATQRIKDAVAPRNQAGDRKVNRKAVGGLLAGLVVVGGVGGGAVHSGRGGGGGGGGATITCNQTAANSAGLASAITAASNGQTICLTAATSYGSFTGTNKTVTIIAQSGTGTASPVNATMTDVTLGSGDSGFTLDGGRSSFGSTGLTVGSMDINGASNLTVKNTAFSGRFGASGASTDGIVIDGNTFDWAANSTVDATTPYKVSLDSLTGTIASPAVTFQNNSVDNGDYDGIHIGGDGVSGLKILSNSLENICASGPNHTDILQFDNIDPGASEIVIDGNLLRSTSCFTQGMTSYDAGTAGVTITDNVVDIGDHGAGIELWGDGNTTNVGSTIQHNTVVYHPSCFADGGNGCGQILMTSKLGGDPAGVNTHVFDNVATLIEFESGLATGTQDHNLCRISGCTGTGTVTGSPTFTGGSTPTSYTDYCLTSGSAGHNAASDGVDMGIRC